MNAIKPLLAMTTLAMFQGVAFGQDPSVAIVAAALSQTTDCRFTDPQQKLMSSGQFSAVDIINAALVTPTLNDLLAYDSVIVWSNTSFQDSVALGDVLADYVDAGGGVVVATFANSDATTTRMILGRWQMGYEVIVPGSGNASGAQSLGNVLDPGHPVMQGVNTFDGGSSSFRPNANFLTQGSTLLAEWTDGRVLVALGSSVRRVDLGMYPPSADCSGSFWNPSTDGTALMANALVFTAGGGGGTPYCFGDGTGTICPCGNQSSPGEGCANSTGSGAILSTTGSIVLSSGNFGLQAIQLQPNAPGIFFQGNNAQGGGNGTLFGDGLLCTGTAIVRLEVAFADASGMVQTSVDVPATGSVSGGDVRRYQYWYRNPNAPFGSPCGTDFNTSNGVEITWIP